MRISIQTSIIVSFLLSCAFAAYGQKMTADEVIAKHLNSIGTTEVRALVKSIIAVGTGTAQFKSTRDQVLEGRVVLASDGIKNFIGMNMNSTLYPGENFAFNGNDSYVAFVNVSARSVLGNFVLSNNSLLSDGLIGGTLSTSWALTRLASSKATVIFGGQKKIDGNEVYVLSFVRKNGGDLDIDLFFDKATFQHVRTEYKRVSSAGIGLRPEDSSRFNETRYKLTEDYSNFKTEAGLTLPHNYRIFYSTTGERGTTEIEWNFVMNEFSANQKIDPATFSSPSNKAQ